MNSLYSRINIGIGKKEMICLVGSGGKTSVMYRLAGELSNKGKRVLVTTTTAIYYPEVEQYDKILVSEKESFDLFDNRSIDCITVLGRSISYEGKLLGVDPGFLDAIFLRDIFEYIIVEGDGSKGRPIKAPAEYEPVIPTCTTKVLGIIGLDSIGKEVCPQHVHRPELFCSLLSCYLGDIIDTDMVVKLIVHKEGLFKGIPTHCERYVVLNKAEGENRRNSAANIVQKLFNMGYEPERMVISSMKEVGI